MSTIRSCSLCFLQALLCAASTGSDGPYEAYVIADQAEVVAGPGHRFYVTDRLARGARVEIYREESSGWLAIRPPEGSFSWIPADYVERLDDGIGKIIEPTAAWVGTSAEHVKEHHEQLTLKTGELVSILSEKTTTTKSGSQQTWLKIAPPAGEFRWIHLRDVSRQKPSEPVVAAAEEPAVTDSLIDALEDSKTTRQEPQRLELAGEPIALESLDSKPARRDYQVQPAQYRQSMTSTPRPVSPDGFVPRKRRDQETASATASAVQPGPVAVRPRPDAAARLASATPVRAPLPLPAPATSTSTPSAPDYSRELEQIELDLSLMLAQDQAQWNFAELERRVQALIESGADPASRGRARLVLDKIKQFEKSFVSAPSTTNASSTSAANTRTASSALTDPRYDAQGTLKEVVSRKTARPAAPYAVVDAEGQPLCFISPSPGLNLNRYLNKPVGVYGRRGYLEELKKPHLVAERVIELERR